jgi:1-acylglycerone phosphate reductase
MSNLSAAGIEVFTLDVTSQESIDALKAEITSLTHGKLDVLYNNAGVREYHFLPCSVLLHPLM